MTRRYVQEAAKLAPKRPDGSYPVVMITEGEGSSGRYSGALLESSAEVFTNVPSFLNHPIDPSRPDLRDVNTIAGRFGSVSVEERDGLKALVSEFKPRAEYASFVEEYADILGLSIYCGVTEFEELADGRLEVKAFDASDPYRSVDIVVAAGRGGRFDRANESLRVIESSLGDPAAKPGSTAAPVTKGISMEKEDLDAIKSIVSEVLAPALAYIATEKAAADAAVAAAETKVSTAEQEKDAAIESFISTAKTISDAGLLPSQEASVLEAAKRGEDVAPLIAEAIKVRDEALTAAGLGGTTYVHESAGASHDFTVTRLIGA